MLAALLIRTINPKRRLAKQPWALLDGVAVDDGVCVYDGVCVGDGVCVYDGVCVGEEELPDRVSVIKSSAVTSQGLVPLVPHVDATLEVEDGMLEGSTTPRTADVTMLTVSISSIVLNRPDHDSVEAESSARSPLME